MEKGKEILECIAEAFRITAEAMEDVARRELSIESTTKAVAIIDNHNIIVGEMLTYLSGLTGVSAELLEHYAKIREDNDYIIDELFEDLGITNDCESEA